MAQKPINNSWLKPTAINGGKAKSVGIYCSQL